MNEKITITDWLIYIFLIVCFLSMILGEIKLNDIVFSMLALLVVFRGIYKAVKKQTPLPTSTMIVAEREGWIANLSSRKLSANPYNVGSPEANSWVRGWNQAEDHCDDSRPLDSL